MVFEDNYLTPALSHYVHNVTEKESPLLANLRHETMSTTLAPQMLCGPMVGQLLKLLVGLVNPKMVVEIGTFTGYSALYMASALRDGKIITCEIDERHASIARNYFERSPHGHKIDLRLGPALHTIDMIMESVDFVFIDADKKNYPNYYEKLVPKVRPGGLIVIDNALWDGQVLDPRDFETKAIAEVNEMARLDPRVETLLLTIRDGVLICRKKAVL